MKNTVVLDLFLGDSGKGKVVDYLAANHKTVVRFNGANNAGHTLKVDGKTYSTHAVPSGVLYSHTTNLIGHGVTLDPYVLKEELESFPFAKVLISGNCHVILPEHIEQDIVNEKKYKIGSTKRGVSPAAISKYGRTGMLYSDFLLTDAEFDKRLPQLRDNAFSALVVYKGLRDFFREYVLEDSVNWIHDNADGLLFEGAQGTFLDIDFGHYPFVTASNSTIGSVYTGTGINPTQIDEVVGLFKAYGSYVGTNEDFKDIEDEDLNNKLCDLGQEYGATTGRRRRLCWLDLDAIKKAVKINGPTQLAITRMDTLGQMPVVKLTYQGQTMEYVPWGDLSGVETIEELPASAKGFLWFIENALGVQIKMVGVGPERDQLLIKE